MSPFAFGPTYCEDLHAVAGAFPAEPWNTVSNAAIMIFGAAALYLVSKRAPRAADLYLLGALIVVNGVGSFLWHGLRERWALTLDVIPGLLVLFTLVFCWMRRLSGSIAAVAFLVLFYLGFALSRQYWGVVQRWVALAPVVIAAGLWLIGQTALRDGRAALIGSAALATALLALGFRTIDMRVCDLLPMGTHFLWHITLSGATFIAILGLLRLPRRRAAQAATQPAH
jgi:Ceramidase